MIHTYIADLSDSGYVGRSGGQFHHVEAAAPV